jgi:hypothetical protein
MITWPDNFELQDPATIPRMDEESREQCRLVAALRRHWNLRPDEHRPIVFAVPNGGKRNAAEAANLKTQGVLAGIHDLIIWLPGGSSILIEMKATNGHLSTSQVGIHAHVKQLGFPSIVAYSAEDALDQLRNLK